MRIILSLGTNLGDRIESIKSASKLLEDAFNCEAKMSHFYESPPYGPQDQPSFLNIALEINTCLNLSPTSILKICKEIEEKLGRKHRYHWGPREIDIDIIFIDFLEVKEERLTIPHKDFRNRSFVLEPLKDLPSFSEYKEHYKIKTLKNKNTKLIL
ncbi:2-amino-4-hydroxy-6-hydroxymethyldihydropteridine diphosphokinase [Halobacteriovorax sp.]|uniref:2-amino-4-hydroxy-6- hydroxymethyldihydropteridine diphosphokinase n=1 Tax=Halobacteriovorax sp. TaxID=2020862 RepID=UPI003AF21334